MNGIKKKKSVVENIYGQYTLGTHGGILINDQLLIVIVFIVNVDVYFYYRR